MNGWMGENDHRGLRGVCDPQHILLAVQYLPEPPILVCRFASTEGLYQYHGVPERMYRILLKSPYAGSYLRKYIKDKFPCVSPDGIPIPVKEDKAAVEAKIERLAIQNEQPLIERTLFGNVVIRGDPPRKRRKPSMTL